MLLVIISDHWYSHFVKLYGKSPECRSNYMNKEAHIISRKKYGITLSADAIWFECADSICANLKTVITKSLLWHRDVKNTNCPGDNVYPLISEWIDELNINYSPVYNSIHFLESTPIDRIMNMNLNTVSSSNVNTDTKIPVGVQMPLKVKYIWKKIWVKLSYPKAESISVSSFTNGLVYAFVGTKKFHCNTEKV